MRVAIVGVKKQGREHLRYFSNIEGVRIVAICDCDTQWIDPIEAQIKNNNMSVKIYTDYRKLLEDKQIDAVILPIPDHLHALYTIWACQAGKDVYVEKPTSWSIWEGRKMVEAQAKYNQIVCVGSQERSDTGLIEFAEYLKENSSALGAIQHIHCISYSQRQSIGKVTGPQPIPETCNYDLFQGPAPMKPLMRTNLHYDWHWCWDTGTGEMGNLGGHVLDDSRWMTGLEKAAPAAISLGGRFGYNDDGETPNVHITYYDYKPYPVIYEIRGLSQGGMGFRAMGNYRGTNFGLVIQFESGYFVGGRGGGWLYDNDGKRVKQFVGDGGGTHTANFIQAVRSRKMSDLRAPIIQGHLSATLCHQGNISYRLGHRMTVEGAKSEVSDYPVLAESFDRFVQYITEAGVDLNQTPVRLGPRLEFDTEQEKFTGEYSDMANMFLKRNYRPPYVIPDTV